MAYVLFSFLLFAASVVTHVLFCRKTANSGLHAKAYIYIALFYLGIYAAGVYAAQRFGMLDPSSFWGLPFKITAAIVFFLLIPIYLVFYTLTQLMSPSKKILICLSRKGVLSYDEILKGIEEEDFINTRLNDLVSSGCVDKTQQGYRLTASGRRIAAVLDLMQLLLGRDMGG